MYNLDKYNVNEIERFIEEAQEKLKIREKELEDMYNKFLEYKYCYFKSHVFDSITLYHVKDIIYNNTECYMECEEIIINGNNYNEYPAYYYKSLQYIPSMKYTEFSHAKLCNNQKNAKEHFNKLKGIVLEVIDENYTKNIGEL